MKRFFLTVILQNTTGPIPCENIYKQWGFAKNVELFDSTWHEGNTMKLVKKGTKLFHEFKTFQVQGTVPAHENGIEILKCLARDIMLKNNIAPDFISLSVFDAEKIELQ